MAYGGRVVDGVGPGRCVDRRIYIEHNDRAVLNHFVQDKAPRFSAPARCEFVVAIAVEIGPAERVRLAQRIVNHRSRPCGWRFFVHHHAVAVPRFHRRQIARAIDTAQFDFSGLPLRDPALRPFPLALPLQSVYAFRAGDPDLSVHANNVVSNMQRTVGNLQ